MTHSKDRSVLLEEQPFGNSEMFKKTWKILFSTSLSSGKTFTAFASSCQNTIPISFPWSIIESHLCVNFRGKDYFMQDYITFYIESSSQRCLANMTTVVFFITAKCLPELLETDTLVFVCDSGRPSARSPPGSGQLLVLIEAGG